MTFEEYLKQQKEQPEQQQGPGRIATFDQYLKQQEQNANPAMKQKFYAASGMDDLRRDFHAYNRDAIDAVSSGLESAQRKCSAQGRQWRTNLAKQRDYFDRYAKYFSEEELTSIREELDSYEAVLNDFDLIAGNQVKLPPPNLSTQAPKAPFNMASDPFGRKSIVEQARKNDPQGEKYRAYHETYRSGGADLLGLSKRISQDAERIAQLERELAEDQYTLDNWPGVQPGHTPSKEMLNEQAVVWRRMERNRVELAGLRQEMPKQEEAYAAYWAFAFADMQDSDEANRKGYAMVGNNLSGDVGEVYRTLMYDEEPTRKDLEKGTVDSVKINGNTLDMGKIARMTKDEKELFFFLCNMGDIEKAEALLREVSGYLAQRYSDDIAEAADIPVLREAIAFATAAGKGVENIGYGVASMFADVEAPEISEGERMQSYWQDKHKGTLAGFTTGAASTMGNMMPAIVGHAVNPVVGSMATFFNTRGNAYAEAKRDGANHEQAWLYSTLTGAAETGLQTILGGAGGLIGGKIPEFAKGFVSKFASKISSNRFGKLMLDWVADVGSEEIEENLQNFLDPAFKMFASISDRYEAPTWEEIAETTIVTAISSTIFFGANQRQESKNAEWQSEYTDQVKKTMEAWEKLQAGTPIYDASQALRRHFAENENISPTEFRDVLLKYCADNSTKSEITAPDWEQYEQEHAGERFTRDRSGDAVDQTEDMELWREDTFEKAQEYSDEKLQQQIEEYRAKRDDSSQDDKSREIAQYHLDALEYTQMQRQNNNAALNEQREEGVNYSGAEGFNDSSQRPSGLGSEGQTGSMAESTSRSVPRGKGKTEKAIVDDIRANAATQSSREIGIIGGSTTADLRVIPAERIGESESWSRIRDEVAARGQKLVLVVGRMETVDPVTKKVYAHEGIRQVAADGTVTYFIKADKILRGAEQIYKHEDFHDIVHNNPTLLPDLVDALEEQYGKQELMSLIYSYVEAFDGVYGTFEDGMTEEAERALAMKYAEEIFADAYGEINRVRRNTTGAKKILQSQTDSVQRAAQNRKATESKTAPPDQRYSYAGRNARTADRMLLHKAQQMLDDGSTMEDIRKETGWHQGFDGKWRFEIDDSRMQYHRNGDARFGEMHPEYSEHQDLTMKFIHGTITNQELMRLHELGSTWGNEQVRLRDRVTGGNAKLSDILSHDALFEAYPELADVSIHFGTLDDGTWGYFDRNKNSIVISDTFRNSPDTILLHEIQHAIQEIEGFAGGANPEYWREIQNGNNAIRKNDSKIKEASNRAEDALRGLPSDVAKDFWYAANMEENDPDGARKLQEELEKGQYADVFDVYYLAIWDLQMLLEEDNPKRSAEELYRNTAGEIEARDSASRRNLSAEDRRLLAPNYGGSNTVVVENEAEQRYYSRKSPEDVVESDVRLLLRQVKNREISGKGYIPVRVSTPGIVCERLFTRDLPLIMPIDKAYQSMSDDNGPVKGKNVRGHQLSEDDMIEIFKRMDSPDYVYDQPGNGRGIEIIKYRSNNELVAVIIEFGQDVNPAYMSGYTGGTYNVSVTVYPIDDGNIGLFDQIKKNKWVEVFSKEKEGDPAKKFPATRPFAVEQGLPDNRLPHGDKDVKQKFSVDDTQLMLEDRVSGDDYLNALDLIEEIKSVGAQVDSFGYVTLYHRTSEDAAKAIYKTGVMSAKEDGLFFSTNPSGENNYGYGNSIVELKVPAEKLVLDDIFGDEASVKISLGSRRRMNVSEYLVRKAAIEIQNFSVDDEVQELDEGYARRMEEDDAPEGLPSEEEALERYYHKAREEKEQRAQSAPIHTLRSRVKSSERAISLQRELKAEMRKIGALSEEAAQNIDARIELIRETMQIDKAALMEKEKLRKVEARKRSKEKKEAEIANQTARTAQKELKQDLLNLFSVREGTRLELGELIDKFSDKLLQQGSLSHEDRKELFDALMDHGEKLAYPEEYFQNVRSYMTQGRIYVNESVRAEFGDDWKAFQNRAWGNRIFLTSDQTDMGIDVWTMALKTEFGGQFDGENDLKTQLEMIVDLAEEGKAEKLTIAEMMQRESEEFGWSVEEQMEELESKVDKLLDIFAQKADLEVRLRQQSLRQRMKDYDLYRTTLERKRAAAMETQARKNVMAAIQKLNKMRKRASPEHRKAIDEALKGIDVVARSISARGLEDLQELKRLYQDQQAKEEANFLRSPYVEARLDRLDKQQLDNMSIEDVVELGRIVCSITNAIQNSKKLLADARNQEVEQAAREVDQEIWESEGSKDGRLRKLTLNHLDAKRFFGQISGWANGTFERLGQELSTGQERQMRYQMNAMRIFDSFLAKKENQKWLKTAAGSEAQWIKVSVPSGFKITKDKMSVITSEIEITPMMRISLLLHSKNEDNLRHIKNGGIRIPAKEQYQKGKMKDAYARGVLVKMDPATVRAIVKNCTEQEKAFARLCESYFNGMAKDCINEVSMVLDGFERAGGEHYYHIKTDPAFLAKQNDTIKRDLSVAATASVVNERKHASNPIVLQDATDALMEHIESISKYYGYSVPLRDLNAVLGQTFHQEENAFSGSVMETLKQKWGSSAEEYIDKLSADLQLPDSSKDYMTDFAVKLRGNYAKAVISANLSSLMKQTTSFPVALPYLKMGGLIHGLKLQSMKQDVKTLEKYSAVYWYRNQGNATTELSDVLKRREFGDALPWVFNATQKMDSWTTRRILAGCEYRVQKDMGLKPGTEAEIAEGTDRYWCEVAKLFNDVVLKTQSNSTMMERPQITRANAGNISRFLTMFRTDSYQQYNMLVEAAGRLRAAKKEYKAKGNTENKKALANARKFAARTVIGTLTGQIGCAFVGVLLKNLRFDDEEFRDENGEWDWGAVADYVGRGVVESYCGFLTCGEWLYAAVEVAIDDDKRWWDAEVNALGMVNDAVTEGLNLIRDLKTGDFLKGRKAIKDTAFAFSKMFGIPAENLEKYLYMCARWFAPEFVAKRENWWDEITKTDLSKESRKTIHEAISVLLDNRTSGLSDQDKEEIARLYLSGGVGAVPAGIPTSISYTDEQGEQITVELSPSQQGEYRELWREIVSPAIGELLASDVYAEAKDEGKTALIDKLYKYAASSVAHELVPDKEIDKWVIQGDTAQDNGISLADYIAFRVELSEVSGKDTSGETVTGLKARKSMELIEAMGWSDKQEKAIWLDVVASDSSAAITKALTKAGLNWNQVNDIVVMTGNKVDKMAAITATGQSDAVKVKAMSVFAGDTEKKLLTVGLRYGIKPEWYTEVLKNANTDGKGGVSQKEAHEYIMGMGLTLQEETVLFQMVTDAKEGKSNPFYQWYAEEFYYEVHKDDPE